MDRADATRNQPLAGKTALVTGAGSGIGAAIAARLAAGGMRLFLAGRNSEALAKVAGQLAKTFPECEPVAVRLDLEESPLRVDDRIPRDGLDLLVHSAGAYCGDSILDTSAAELANLLRINVTAPFELTQLLTPALVQSRGQLVFVGSSVVSQPVKAVPGAYAISKYAAKTLTDSLRDALNTQGVRVLGVHPGRTATPMQELLFAQENRAYLPETLLQPEDIARAVYAALCLPPTAELTEISIRPSYFKPA